MLKSTNVFQKQYNKLYLAHLYTNINAVEVSAENDTINFEIRILELLKTS